MFRGIERFFSELFVINRDENEVLIDKDIIMFPGDNKVESIENNDSKIIETPILSNMDKIYAFCKKSLVPELKSFGMPNVRDVIGVKITSANCDIYYKFLGDIMEHASSLSVIMYKNTCHYHCYVMDMKGKSGIEKIYYVFCVKSEEHMSGFYEHILGNGLLHKFACDLETYDTYLNMASIYGVEDLFINTTSMNSNDHTIDYLFKKMYTDPTKWDETPSWFKKEYDPRLCNKTILQQCSIMLTIIASTYYDNINNPTTDSKLSKIIIMDKHYNKPPLLQMSSIDYTQNDKHQMFQLLSFNKYEHLKINLMRMELMQHLCEIGLINTSENISLILENIYAIMCVVSCDMTIKKHSIPNTYNTLSKDEMMHKFSDAARASTNLPQFIIDQYETYHSIKN